MKKKAHKIFKQNLVGENDNEQFLFSKASKLICLLGSTLALIFFIILLIQMFSRSNDQVK